MNKPHAPSQTKFLNHLAARFPEVAEIIHARREKNGGRIYEFVEMNALTKWLGSMQSRSRGSGPAAEHSQAVVREFLDELENQFDIGDVGVENLIAVGLLLQLEYVEEFPALRALLPPRMSAWFAEWLDPGGRLNKPNPPAVVAFMNELASRFPDAAKVIQAQRREDQRILPYVEMGALILWLGSVQARTREPGTLGERATVGVRDFLDYLEHQFEGGDADIRNLIAVGFLEGLGLTKDEYPALRALLPPRMSAWHASDLGDGP